MEVNSTISQPGVGAAKRRLIFRLSSLGDVILATAALEAIPSGETADWAVAREFAEILEGHPKIGNLYRFDRHSGLGGWVKICRDLWSTRYDEVLDLHGSLRTRIAEWLFIWWSFRHRAPMPRWCRVSKQRVRLYGYFVFKRLWPKILRPRLFTERFSRLAGGTGSERPDLRHLVHRPDGPGESAQAACAHPAFSLKPRSYVCVMPGAKWKGKRWAPENYAALIKVAGVFPVVLGERDSPECLKLLSCLQELGVVNFSGVGLWSLPSTAKMIANSAGFLGSDTGLAHLAEAVGAPAVILYGPTAPDAGFGPGRSESMAAEAKIWCRPCGKDGRFCFRIKDRHRCQEKIDSEEVLRHLMKLIETGGSQ